MHYLAILIIIVGFVIAIVSKINILLIAFRDSAAWGIACIFLPGASLLYAASHWDECRNPFLRALLGSVLIFAGIIMIVRQEPPPV